MLAGTFLPVLRGDEDIIVTGVLDEEQVSTDLGTGHLFRILSVILDYARTDTSITAARSNNAIQRRHTAGVKIPTIQHYAEIGCPVNSYFTPLTRKVIKRTSHTARYDKFYLQCAKEIYY